MRWLCPLLLLVIFLPLPLPLTAAETRLSDVPKILAGEEISADTTAVTVAPPAPPEVDDPATIAKKKLAEWQRRLKIEADKPWTCFAGALTIYKNADGQGEKVKQPAGEGFRVLDSSGTMIKVYSPYFDTICYFNRLETCGFRGISWDTFDWSGVNFRLGSQMVQQPKEFTFPDSLDWSHPPVPPVLPIPATSGNTATAPPVTTAPPATPGSGPPSPTSPTTPGTTTAPPPTTVTMPVTPPARITDSPAPPAVSGTPGQITHPEAVHVRAEKALESAEIIVIQPGSPLQVLENDGNWCRVLVEGKTGFVRSKYLGL